ncbi:MAG: tRNA (uridine(54)-C5)-methyltransferase TrmA [Porticoccaceae bacterium]|nr:tRNA (uridine(54)-C5)-methyltransferase TrmA [Porticoccaceae bacterium]
MKAIDPELYPAQLEAKQTNFIETLKGLDFPQPEVFDSAPSQFRMRAEFRIWHEEGRAHYAMNRAGEKRPYIIDSFPIGGPLINQLMTPLIEAINKSPALSRKLFCAEFLTTLSGEVLVTLIYHRPVDDEWQQAALELQSQLNIMVIGRSRKQKVVLERDYVVEKLSVDGREYSYQQVESGFTQPNAEVNQKMLSWASSCCASEDNSNQNNDLLELYCGNGNFTAVLAQHFKQVLATEISKISVRSAETNFTENKVDNVTVVRMSSEEFTQALNGERPFRRLKDIELDSYNFSTIFVDPPRAGLDDGTLKLAQRFDRILYVSCNPQTLRTNLDRLTETHEIVRTAIFDQFPWTDHLESGVLLVRR